MIVRAEIDLFVFDGKSKVLLQRKSALNLAATLSVDINTFPLPLLRQSLYDDGTETTRKQLLTGSEVLQMAGEECMEPLLELWRGVVKRIYHLYQLSASAYFIFLQLNDSSMVSELFFPFAGRRRQYYAEYHASFL